VTCPRMHNRCDSHRHSCRSSCTGCAGAAGAAESWRTPARSTARSEKRRTKPPRGTCLRRSRAPCNIRPGTWCRRCAALERSSRWRSSNRLRSRADSPKSRRGTRGPRGTERKKARAGADLGLNVARRAGCDERDGDAARPGVRLVVSALERCNGPDAAGVRRPGRGAAPRKLTIGRAFSICCGA
jgi:hypothetical protein